VARVVAFFVSHFLKNLLALLVWKIKTLFQFLRTGHRLEIPVRGVGAFILYTLVIFDFFYFIWLAAI